MVTLQPSASKDSRVPLLLAIVLGLLAASALLLRWTSIAQPLGIDQSLWASAARGMARGQLLYHDLWEQRPPGIYLVYLTGFRMLGWHAATIAWLDNLAAVAMTLLLYLVARQLTSRLTAAVAAALYAVLTMPAWLFNHGGFLERSVCETFIVVAAGAGAWCAVMFRRRPSLAAAFGMGLSGGAAVLMKPNAGIYVVAVLAWLALYLRPLAERRADVPRWLAAVVLGGVLLPLLTLAWLSSLGVLPDARTAVVDFNRYYVTLQYEPLDYAIKFSKAVWLRMRSDPVWLAGGVAALAAVVELLRARRLPPLVGLAVLWGCGCVIAIMVNGTWLFNSYFLQAYPPLVLLGAWLLVDAARASRVARVVAAVTACLMVVVLVRGHFAAHVLDQARQDLGVLRGRVERSAYLDRFGGYDNGRGYSARANEELADYVRANTSPDDRIFVFGISGAGVYFASDRLTAHRFLRVNFFVDTGFPNPAFRLDPVVDDLAKARPRYLVFERLHSATALGAAVDGLEREPRVQQLLAGYQLERRIEDFTLYRLNSPATSR